ncbi:MAG TPA: iron ABC transporter permease [Acidimicrobiales bacterium]|nr:iron ABC transporter permease [Acidimicrobiales bacterium]
MALLPLAYLVVRATERGWAPVRATLWRDRTLELVGRSLWLAATVTAACLVIGIGAAWLVSRTDLPGRRVWRVALGMPLALPSYVAAWAWLARYPSLAGFRGAWLVLTSVSFPYVYLPVLAALRRSDPALEEVARSLGRRPMRVFLSVTVRQVRIAATGGALLVGLYALSDFGAVSIMRYQSLTHVIYISYRASFDRTPAAVLGLVLAALAIVIVLVDAWTRGESRTAKVGAGTPRAAPPVPLGRWRWPAVAAVASVVGFSLGVPLWSLNHWLQRGRSRADWSQVVDATASTLTVSALAAVATIALAIPVGVLSARYAGRLSRAVTAAAYAGHALPGIVVALALVFFGIRLATPLYQTTSMLVFAYVVLFLSLAIGAVHGSVSQAPPELEDVARSLGRTQIGAWRSITLRLAAPGVGAGAALVFLTVMKELPATLLLRPIGMDTLATRLWSHTANASFAAAAPYAAAIILLAALPTALLTRDRT